MVGILTGYLGSVELSGCDVYDLLVVHSPDFRKKEEVETFFVFEFITKIYYLYDTLNYVQG
jgi:hypothetical protein